MPIFIYIYFMMFVVIISQNKKNQRKRRQMGPRLNVTNEVFLQELDNNNNTVIRGPKVLWQGYTYLTAGKDYYYYAVSKEPLELPEGVSYKEVKQILL